MRSTSGTRSPFDSGCFRSSSITCRPPGFNSTGFPAGSSTASTGRIFIVVPCIDISCTWTTAAADELAPTRRAGVALVTVM